MNLPRLRHRPLSNPSRILLLHRSLLPLTLSLFALLPFSVHHGVWVIGGEEWNPCCGRSKSVVKKNKVRVFTKPMHYAIQGRIQKQFVILRFFWTIRNCIMRYENKNDCLHDLYHERVESYNVYDARYLLPRLKVKLYWTKTSYFIVQSQENQLKGVYPSMQRETENIRKKKIRN